MAADDKAALEVDRTGGVQRHGLTSPISVARTGATME